MAFVHVPGNPRPQPARKPYLVRLAANRKQWDVVAPSGEIVEGGFFSRNAAEAACAEWNARPL